MTAPAGPVAGFLRRLSQHGLTDLPDAELLARFVRDRDEAAFTQLLRRHGPMVLGAARRVLANAADAEDVTQAVFLILARRAGRFDGVPNVGGWLHGVAVRTALHARAKRHRRRVVEARAARPEEAPAVLADGLAAVVDRAVQSLPAKLRDAVVLCDLEGETRQAAANRLGVPLGTVSSRLAAAHAKLATKLARPFAGAVLASVGMADALTGATLAAVFAHDPRGVPAAVSVLVLEVTRMMWLTKLKLAAGGVVAALAVGAAGVGVGRQAMADEPKAVPAKPAVAPPAVIAPARRSDQEAAERKKFVGTWRIVSETLNGKPEKPKPGGFQQSSRITFDDRGHCLMHWTADDAPKPTGGFQVFRILVNPHRKHKELLLVSEEWSMSGIYEIDGDTLRWAMYVGDDGVADRPHGFAVTDQPPGSPDLAVHVMKRDKTTSTK